MAEFERMHCEHTGVVMEAFVALPNRTGRSPAVIMFPGATGTGRTFEATARDLADRGYAAIGASVYDRNADISTPEAAGTHFMALLEDPQTLRARVVAWLEAVRQRSDIDSARIAAIGYCFGGKCVLELARSGAELQAVVSFHGLLTTHAPAQPGAVRADVVAYCGGKDPYAPVEHLEGLRKELEAAGARHQITLFSHAEHSFTDPDHDGLQPGIAYDALAHRLSWAGTLALLDAKLDGAKAV